MQEVVGSTPILSTTKPLLGAFFMQYIVYIIYSESMNKYYTGSCEDFSIRLAQHNAGRNKSTKPGIPWVLKHSELFNSLKEARAREAHIKKMKSRKYIETLILSNQ
jgi:putative endonuclease